jgi:hypothetical protein
MSRSRLSSRGWAGLAILAAAIMFMAATAAAPYVWQASLDARLAEAKSELGFIETKLKTAKNGPQASLLATDDIEPMFLPGATPGLALAGLQSLVGKIAQDNGMVVQRIQPLQTDAGNGIAVLRMEVETEGGLESLRGYLLTLETGLPLIVITEAKISAPDAVESETAALPSDKLSVSLQLEAYGWRGDTP